MKENNDINGYPKGRKMLLLNFTENVFAAFAKITIIRIFTIRRKFSANVRVLLITIYSTVLNTFTGIDPFYRALFISLSLFEFITVCFTANVNESMYLDFFRR